MPTVNVSKEGLFGLLGRRFTEAEIEKLCFDFGLEYDGETSQRRMAAKERGEAIDAAADADDELLLRIEVPANRYDLLSAEGLATALRAFLGGDLPRYVADPPAGVSVVVERDVLDVRPFVVCAVLRGVRFTDRSFLSFIDLQDKLHQTLCKRRALASIGTHDLASVQAPFTYTARAPEAIRFVPLRGTGGAEVDGRGCMAALEADLALRDYLPLVRDRPRYPVFVDAGGRVMSLPPVINGTQSRMSVETRDVFVEVTATDRTKADVVLNTVVCLFSLYAGRQWHVEQVRVAAPDGAVRLTPDLSYRTQRASVAYINRALGLKLAAAEQLALLRRMGVPGTAAEDGAQLVLEIPPTRSDILHECDVMEDVAVAYGFNNLKPVQPPTPTVGHQLERTKLAEKLAEEVAMAGFTEVMTWILGTAADNFQTLGRPDDGSAVAIANSKTADFQTGRTTLLTALLRCVATNKAVPLPIRVFEVGDVVLRDPKDPIGARNVQRICAVHCAATAGLDITHGLLDRVMLVLGVPSVLKAPNAPNAYSLRGSNDAAFLPEQRADIYVGETRVGSMGIVHPETLSRVSIDNPCSAFEISLDFPRGV